jgi:hypothetical protein
MEGINGESVNAVLISAGGCNQIDEGPLAHFLTCGANDR